MDSLTICKKDCVTLIAGPCSVESEQQVVSAAKLIADCGLSWMRGGAFKPRTNPKSFQGLGLGGVDILRDAAHASSLHCITELVDAKHIQYLMTHVDAIQIGARNMMNYELLKEVAIQTAEQKTPILFKRSMASTIDEWLQTTQYLTEHGNNNIVLCERGIRSFETQTRFTLDIASVPIVHNKTNYCIAVDASHPAGDAALVPSLARAGVAAGADAIMVEIHPDPVSAKSDAQQQLSFKQFENLVAELRILCEALGKTLI